MKTIRIVLAICFVVITTAFLLMTIQSLTWDYNEEGNHFDEASATNSNDNGIIGYGVLTVVFLVPTIIFMNSIFKSKKRIS